MRRETKEKLDRLWRRRKYKEIAGVTAVGLVGLYIVLWFTLPAPVADRSTAYGEVTNWTRAQNQTGRPVLYLSATLENGTPVTIIQSTARAPRKGDRIKITKLVLKDGRVRYRWVE